MISPPTTTTYAANVNPFPSSIVLKERQKPAARLRTAAQAELITRGCREHAHRVVRAIV